MNRPNPALLATARRLLANERAAGVALDGATAAGLVLDKLHVPLVPLMGSAGVQALLARSVRLTLTEVPFLTNEAVESGGKLRDCLHGLDDARAIEAAVALVGAFLTLITTFIGERLTTQVLRSAWPTIEEAGPLETKQ